MIVFIRKANSVDWVGLQLSGLGGATHLFKSVPSGNNLPGKMNGKTMEQGNPSGSL